mgnify:CR=1
MEYDVIACYISKKPKKQYRSKVLVVMAVQCVLWCAVKLRHCHKMNLKYESRNIAYVTL